MILRARGRKYLLSYEMNVHRGDTRRQLLDAIDRYVVPVRDRVRADGPFGIAPRVGRTLLRELAAPRAAADLRARLEERGLFALTVNAFPLQDFHARRVKEQVYSPPWTTRERAVLTQRAADLLAILAPDGLTATISTLGGTYRSWGHEQRDFERMAGHYLLTVRHLAEIERRTGKRLVLTVEPEPDTTLETADDVVALVDRFLRPKLAEVIARPLRLARAAAADLFQRHFQVNLDVCHQSVLFRDPVQEWRKLEAAGLSVGKLHLTSALALERPGRRASAFQELRHYDEPRYLHQFAARREDHTLVRGADLSHLDAVDLRDVTEVRCHFHVPLSSARIGRLGTTRADTERALRFALRHPQPPALVIETYTWPLLASGRSPERQIRGIAREYRWVRSTAAAPLRNKPRK
ncbi:MAG: metabolite traffic protein EboE [Planctomycetota bacterium]